MDLHDLWVLSRNLRRQGQSVVLELIRDSLWCTSDELRWFCTLSNSLMNVRKSGAASMYNADLISNHHQLVLPIAVFMRLIHQIKFINRPLNNKISECTENHITKSFTWFGSHLEKMVLSNAKNQRYNSSKALSSESPSLRECTNDKWEW